MTARQENSLEKELQISVELAQEASKAILPYYYGGVEREKKEDGTPVTKADKLASKIIVEGLLQAFPEDSIVSEEGDGTEQHAHDNEFSPLRGRLFDPNSHHQRTWYVDSIDGTKGFLGHSDQFAIHIGRTEWSWDYDNWKYGHRTSERPCFGLVYKPTTGEYYFGNSQQGAWRVHPDGSKKELSRSTKGGLSMQRERGKQDSGLSFMLSASDLREHAQLIDALQPSKILISGSMGLRWMSIVESIADAYIKVRPAEGGTWDVCAPQAILEAAGGVVRYRDGSTLEYYQQRRLDGALIAARSEEVFRRVAEKVNAYFALKGY